MKKVVYCDETTDIVGPEVEMVDTIAPGGRFIARINPGCWGTMITPEVKSWHEVSLPVRVEGAERGDAAVIKIKDINVLSRATSSGTDKPDEDYFHSDPGVDSYCPECGEKNPSTYVKGTGQKAVHCKECETPVTPFSMPHGYTMYFDPDRELGITVDENMTGEIAGKAEKYSNLSHGGRQHSINVFGQHDLTGTAARVIPMVGNIGTTPSVNMPSSHNTGDFGQFLIGAEHEYSCSEKDLKERTDAHMDIREVREGAVILAPVKVEGAGVYIGDAHAMQGDGEVAGHTTDVSAEVEVQVDLIKDVNLDGPILLPRKEDLPPLARPYTAEEKEKINKLGQETGLEEVEDNVWPIQAVGSGENLNSAIQDGIEKLSRLLNYSTDEVKNRVTINGEVRIGRAPGVVNITVLVPDKKLEKAGIEEPVREQYEL